MQGHRSTIKNLHHAKQFYIRDKNQQLKKKLAQQFNNRDVDQQLNHCQRYLE